MIASKDQFILHYICINKILLTNHAHTMSPIPRWGVSSRVPQVHSQDEPTFHIFYFQKPHEGHLISRRLNFLRCNFCFPCSKSRIVRLEFGHSGPHKPVEPKVVIFYSFQNVNNLIVQVSKLDCTSLLVDNVGLDKDIVARVVRALVYQASWEYLLALLPCMLLTLTCRWFR